MKRIILILLGLFSLAYGQFSNTGAKTRFVNGISLGTKLDGYYNSADSNAIYWRADSVLRAKYRGIARSLAFQGDTTGFGSRFIYNQFGSNLSAQTAKMYITDTIRTDGAVRASKGNFSGTVAGDAVMGIVNNSPASNAYTIVANGSSVVAPVALLTNVSTGGGITAVGGSTAENTAAVYGWNGNLGDVWHGGNGSLITSRISYTGKITTVDSIVGSNARITGSISAANGAAFIDTDGILYNFGVDIAGDYANGYAGRFNNSNIGGRGVAINAGTGQLDALTIRDYTQVDTLLRVKGNGTLLVGDPSSNNDSLIVNGVSSLEVK